MGQSLVEAVFNVGKSPPLLREIKKCFKLGNENKICRIGQHDRCSSTGCEWKKVFGYNCSNTVRVDNEVEKIKNKEAIKTLEKNKIKTNKKLNEEKDFINKIQEIKTNQLNISTVKQDDWINKIKVLKNENKFK